jgi:predicted permease
MRHVMPGILVLAIRGLLRRRGLTAGAIATVAVVMTAVNAVAGVALAVFVRPLPFMESDRLVRIFMQPPGAQGYRQGVSHPPITFLRMRERVRAFEAFEGMWIGERAVAGDGEPESVRAARTSAGYFRMLGASPVAGRVFTEADVTADAKLVVLSHGLWQRRFGAQRSALGRTMDVDGEPHVIIGVLGPDFDPTFTLTEFWTPLNLRAFERQQSSFLQVVGRLRAGVAAEQAALELNGLMPAIRTEMPVLEGWRPGVIGLRDATYGPQRPVVLLLVIAVALLAALAAANLMNLTLADVLSRQSDFALQAALGASRRRIAAPEFARAWLIAAIGGAAGLAGATLLLSSALALDSASLLSRLPPRTDWRLILIGLGTAGAIMTLAVAVPVRRSAAASMATRLAGGAGRTTGSRTSARIRHALVVAQTALALVLLATGSHVALALHRTAAIDPGFDPAGVVTAQLRLPAAKYGTEALRTHVIERLLESLRATPGVVSAGTTLNPFTGGSFVTVVHVEDRPQPDGQPHSVQFRRISPGYLDTMRIRLVSGRDVDGRDRAGGQSVALVSQSFARRFWPGGDAVGRRIRRGTAPEWLVIVGVVNDVRDLGLGAAIEDTVYTPFFQGSATGVAVSLVVRTQGAPERSIRDIQQAVWRVDPAQPLANVVTLERFLDNTLGPQRFRVLVIAVCAVLGLLLAVIGVYAITARSVSERRREVGIRLALGGRPRAVWWTVATASLRAVAAGVVLGAMAATLAGRGLQALLPEIEAAGLTFAALAGVVLLATGALSALSAARGAARVDPMVALRGH